MSYTPSNLSIATDGKTLHGSATSAAPLALGGAVPNTYPRAANAVALTSGTTSWANPASFTTIVASTAAAGTVLGIVIDLPSANAGGTEFDIATGGVGSEVVIATLRASQMAVAPTAPLIVPCLLPAPYATGVRLSARVRCSQNAATACGSITVQVAE